MRLFKKGQIEVYQVVMLILFVVGLAILLFFWYSFKNTTNLSDDTCHLSALTRGTTPSAGQSYIPLKCTTKKICITSDSSKKCTDSFAGESDISVVALPSDNLRAANLIEKTSVESMYNCWSMLGQGKLDLVGNFPEQFGLTSSSLAKPYCIICSRVAIDKSVDGNIMKNVNLYSYMKYNGPTGQQLTYLQLFTDPQFKSYPVVNPSSYQDIGNKDSSGKEVSINSSQNQIAFVFMQIKAKDISKVIANLGEAGAITLGGSFLTGPTRSAAGALIFSGGVAGFIYKAAIATGIIGQAAINTYSGQITAAGYCGAFTGESQNANLASGAAGTSNGCSLIQSIPYSANSVNQLCSVIDGNP